MGSLAFPYGRSYVGQHGLSHSALLTLHRVSVSIFDTSVSMGSLAFSFRTSYGRYTAVRSASLMRRVSTVIHPIRHSFIPHTPLVIRIIRHSPFPIETLISIGLDLRFVYGRYTAVRSASLMRRVSNVIHPIRHSFIPISHSSFESFVIPHSPSRRSFQSVSIFDSSTDVYTAFRSASLMRRSAT